MKRVHNISSGFNVTLSGFQLCESCLTKKQGNGSASGDGNTDEMVLDELEQKSSPQVLLTCENSFASIILV